MDITKYTRKQLLKANQFKDYIDLINSSLFDDENTYTVNEAKKLIAKYLKGKVN